MCVRPTAPSPPIWLAPERVRGRRTAPHIKWARSGRHRTNSSRQCSGSPPTPALESERFGCRHAARSSRSRAKHSTSTRRYTRDAYALDLRQLSARCWQHDRRLFGVRGDLESRDAVHRGASARSTATRTSTPHESPGSSTGVANDGVTTTTTWRGSTSGRRGTRTSTSTSSALHFKPVGLPPATYQTTKRAAHQPVSSTSAQAPHLPTPRSTAGTNWTA